MISKACSSGCQTCTNSSTCQACSPGNYFVGTACVKCPKGKFVSSSTSCDGKNIYFHDSN